MTPIVRDSCLLQHVPHLNRTETPKTVNLTYIHSVKVGISTPKKNTSIKQHVAHKLNMLLYDLGSLSQSLVHLITLSRSRPGTDLGCAVIGDGDEPSLVVRTPGHAGDFSRVTAQPAIRFCQHHRSFWKVLCTKAKHYCYYLLGPKILSHFRCDVHLKVTTGLINANKCRSFSHVGRWHPLILSESLNEKL